ncbi:MAG: prephenate dehydrogenase/arogenate dehydrogenase family protein [Candidatus Gastranaerophilales bacterium]|nr:prephenate dehydrogenase/arogenate dehydrogenase family protein [Candidatus Gastranaerophilales bacterium]
MSNNNLKIGIAGLGLIGGSIYKTLYAHGFKNLYCLTSNENTLKDIVSDGFHASDKTDVLIDCDLIFICSPISQTVNMIKKCFEINKDAIYVDVASLKKNILSEIENGMPDCKFIGSHPMAGTENSGFDASFAGLFEDATWVITPSRNVENEDIIFLIDIISNLGANVVELNADEHDKAVALISHTPMLLSQALMSSALDNDVALSLALCGFRDMTRLSMSNKIMAKDMLNLNRDNIKESLQLIIDRAQKLLNSDYFDENIDKIIETRKNLYTELGKNNYNN